MLLGTAVGDALGLPAEGLRPTTIKALGWHRWRHRLLAGRGMLSDDTEHSAAAARSLLEHPADADAFARALARRLRWWIAALPAGVGLATARAIFKLWLGWPPGRSGVWSAGNGGAMRCAIIGAYFFDQPEQRRAFIERSTRLTHTDPRALTGALAVGLAAAHACGGESPCAALPELARLAPEDRRWAELMQTLERGLDAGWQVGELARELGLERGVTGFVYHTVPVALYAWLRHGEDFVVALTSVLDCGGDTDTVGAITGAICGAAVGEGGIPPGWIEGIVDAPLGPPQLRQLADALAAARVGQGGPAPSWRWWLVPPRNAVFLCVVLAHGLLRLLPLVLRRRLWRGSGG